MGRPPRGASKGLGWGQGSEAQGLPPSPPLCNAVRRFLLPLCWLGRMEETEAHRKSGRGDKLNHRVEQKPSQEETGSKLDVG